MQKVAFVSHVPLTTASAFSFSRSLLFPFFIIRSLTSVLRLFSRRNFRAWSKFNCSAPVRRVCLRYSVLKCEVHLVRAVVVFFSEPASPMVTRGPNHVVITWPPRSRHLGPALRLLQSQAFLASYWPLRPPPSAVKALHLLPKGEWGRTRAPGESYSLFIQCTESNENRLTFALAFPPLPRRLRPRCPSSCTGRVISGSN